MRPIGWIIVTGVALALLGCRREPDVDSSKAARSGKDVTVADPARAPDTVTLVGTLTALGKAPDVIPGDIPAQQTVTLQVESAEGADVAAGTTAEILITILGHVPAIGDPAPELDPAYFRVGRRFRIATMRAGGRYHARIDKGAIEPLD
jgi:hypothetical protein